jgi:hypothetical protein
MGFQPDRKQRRQAAYRHRAARAFFMAKLLLPAVCLGVSAAAWSDPVLGPRLESGLDEVRPMVQAVLEGKSVMDVLAATAVAAGPEAAQTTDDATGDTLDDRPSTLAAGLPASVVPINRPGKSGAVTE